MAKRLCPQLILVRGNYEKYGEAAKVFRKIFAEYDPGFHSGGLDEAYLNLTEFMKNRSEPVQLIGHRFGGECLCRLPEWTSESANQYPDPTEQTKDCEKCGKKQIDYTYNVIFGTDIADVVHEIRFRVEQETNGLTCSAGK
jgi:DNA polymerase kappa